MTGAGKLTQNSPFCMVKHDLLSPLCSNLTVAIGLCSAPSIFITSPKPNFAGALLVCPACNYSLIAWNKIFGWFRYAPPLLVLQVGGQVRWFYSRPARPAEDRTVVLPLQLSRSPIHAIECGCATEAAAVALVAFATAR